MSRPLVCDNPGCETLVRVDELGEDAGPPIGWAIVAEVDDDGDQVELGEFCSRACAAAYLTLEASE